MENSMSFTASGLLEVERSLATAGIKGCPF